MKSIAVFVSSVLLSHQGSSPATATSLDAVEPDPNKVEPSYARFASIDHLPPTFRGYPFPTYIPAGYGLYEMSTDRPDGFGGAGELALWYADRKLHMGLNNPLNVWLAPNPLRPSLVGNRPGQPVVLALPSGETVQAQYHDGMWAQDPQSRNFYWQSQNVHSVSFRWRTFTIAIRGARLAGLDQDELVRVASSIATQTN